MAVLSINEKGRRTMAGPIEDGVDLLALATELLTVKNPLRLDSSSSDREQGFELAGKLILLDIARSLRILLDTPIVSRPLYKGSTQ